MPNNDIRPRVVLKRTYVKINAKKGQTSPWHWIQFTVRNVSGSTVVALLQKPANKLRTLERFERMQLKSKNGTYLYSGAVCNAGEQIKLGAVVRVRAAKSKRPVKTVKVTAKAPAAGATGWQEEPVQYSMHEVNLHLKCLTFESETMSPILTIPVFLQLELPAGLNIKKYVLDMDTGCSRFKIRL